jgi:plastocyanin
MQSFVVTALLAVFSWLGGPRPSVNGVIEGKVTVRQLPKRIGSDYPGQAAAAHAVQTLPVVVFLSGTIGGIPADAATPTMAQRDTSFQPSLLIIPTGTTVRFPNEDKFFHNVFSYSKPKRFDLGRYPRGEAKNVTFDQAGGVTVLCEIHKWMRGGIVVVENKYYDTVDEAGSFRIANVPPGKYQLVVWHAERGRKTYDVTVPAAGSARVDAAF